MKKSSSESLADENNLSDRSIHDASLDTLSEIKTLRLRNVNNIIVENININSLPNKFEQLKELVMKHIDVLVFTETKLNNSMPTSQFLVKGFHCTKSQISQVLEHHGKLKKAKQISSFFQLFG